MGRYEAFVRAQQDRIIREFMDEPGQCFVGIHRLDQFKNRYFGKNSIRPLPGSMTMANAFIWAQGAGTEELWVKPYDKSVTRSDAYRTYWDAFVTSLDAGPVMYSIGGRAQVVDHLLPETFAARQGYAYVRVMMVDYRGNATVGSTVEASMARRDSPGHSTLADSFTVAKASCFRDSFAAAVPGATVMAALRAHLATRGFTIPAGQEAIFAQGMEAILAWSRSV